MSEPTPLEAIFFAALAKVPGERATYLNAACGGDANLCSSVERMLAAQADAGSFLESPPSAVAATSSATLDQPPEIPGTQIGPYKLLEQIGEGGMGTVWMAQQTEPVRRLVAVKLIKAGMDSRQVIARFEAERQALALMDHANIARVLDAGTTSAGRPYFVMDLVRGVPITRYCDEHHLTPRQRLELFIPVCQAIQHAHQKGIIHRDLKPNNVLVALYDGKPVPKVIDFGVAKATGQSLTDKTLVTGFGNIIGTLEYMSPEQAETNQLDIDTRSDIYSLGVLLYELLTGSTPFSRKDLEQAGMLEMLRVIREEEPSKPSTKLAKSTSRGPRGTRIAGAVGSSSPAEPAGPTLASIAANRGTEPAKLTKLVRGELDWIVMKALEKDRSRRYETANGFAADIERYLNDEPVQACPPSAWYRFWKFARRNKPAVVTTSLVAGALIAAIGVLAISNVRITQERDEKNEALKQKAAALKQQYQALQEARKQRQLAMSNLRDARKAVDQMLTRVAVERLGDQPEMRHVRRDLLEDALKFYQGFLEQTSSDPSIRAETGLAYCRAGEISRFLFSDLRRANELFARAIPLLAQATVDFPEISEYRHELGRCHNGLAKWHAAAGRTEEAAKEHRRALEQFEELGRAGLTIDREGTRRQELAYTYVNLSEVLENERPDEAEEGAREVVRLCEQLDTEFPTHPYIQGWMGRARLLLARLMLARGESAEADKLYRQFREQNPATAQSSNSMAWILITNPDPKIRDPKRAVELARKAIDLQPIGEHWNTLGAALYRAGEWNAAVEALNKSSELRTGGDGWDWIFLAMAHWQLGDKDEARVWRDKATDWMDKNQATNEELRRFRAEAEALMNERKGDKEQETDKQLNSDS